MNHQHASSCTSDEMANVGDREEPIRDIIRHPSFQASTVALNSRFYMTVLCENKIPTYEGGAVFFNMHRQLKYENFFRDFGPLNIAMVYRYCTIVNDALNNESFANRKIIHYLSCVPQKVLNAAFLVGAYGIIYHDLSVSKAMEVLADIIPLTKGLNYCDASQCETRYLPLTDCLGAIYKARNKNFFNLSDFNHREYEFYERVENGDLNWIVPNTFLAFCGPHNETRSERGTIQHSPDTYIDYFRQQNVTGIIRLNHPRYNAKSFTKAGFQHLDLIYPDGANPDTDILQKFLSFCEEQKGAVAVHCKAGLGRTGTLIAAYLMKHYGFTAMEAIAWLRICRPGSVIGQQQVWLKQMQISLWNEGYAYRRKHPNSTKHKHEVGIYSMQKNGNEIDMVDGENDQSDIQEHVQGISNQVNTMRLNDEDEQIERLTNDNQKNNNTIHLKSNRALSTGFAVPTTKLSSLSSKLGSRAGNNAKPCQQPSTTSSIGTASDASVASHTVAKTVTTGVAPPLVRPVRHRLTCRMSTGGDIKRFMRVSQGDQLNQIKVGRRRRVSSVQEDGTRSRTREMNEQKAKDEDIASLAGRAMKEEDPASNVSSNMSCDCSLFTGWDEPMDTTNTNSTPSSSSKPEFSGTRDESQRASTSTVGKKIDIPMVVIPKACLVNKSESYFNSTINRHELLSDSTAAAALRLLPHTSRLILQTKRTVEPSQLGENSAGSKIPVFAGITSPNQSNNVNQQGSAGSSVRARKQPQPATVTGTFNNKSTVTRNDGPPKMTPTTNVRHLRARTVVNERPTRASPRQQQKPKSPVPAKGNENSNVGQDVNLNILKTAKPKSADVKRCKRPRSSNLIEYEKKIRKLGDMNPNMARMQPIVVLERLDLKKFNVELADAEMPGCSSSKG